MLVDTALGALDGVVLVEVKTLDASAEYEPYEAARAFWEHCGISPGGLHRPVARLAARQPGGDLHRRAGVHPVAEQSLGGRRRTDRHANERGIPDPDDRGGDPRHRGAVGCVW